VSGLNRFRGRLDELDDQITGLLGERFAVCREIALYKRANQIPMMQPGRVTEVRRRYLMRGAAAELPADFTENLFELLIAATCRMEDELIDSPFAVDPPSAVDLPSTVDPPSAVDGGGPR
jgi:chorismate mutase